jgi:hypothetical protein
MPQPLKYLIWAAVGLAAMGTIWKVIQGHEILKIVLKELTTNSGSSMKDKLDQAAKDSKEALDVSREALEVCKRLDPKVTAIVRHQRMMDQELSGVREGLSQVKTTIARQIIHTVHNDMHTSELLKEEQRILEEEEKRKKCKTDC